MSRPTKGPRLFLRKRKGRAAVWVVRDGSEEHSTGCCREDAARAETALENYIVGKHRPPTGPARLEDILIADVINAYVKDHAPTTLSADFILHTSRPLLDWWRERSLADIRGGTCREYVKWRVGQGVLKSTARHDLSTLSAAINFYHQEFGPLAALPKVVLPKKPVARDRWLTRDEVARLLRAARATRACGHIVRFILIAIYSGTRSRAILGLKWTPSRSNGHFDLENGVLYRKGRTVAESTKRQPPARIHAKLLPHLKHWRRQDWAAANENDRIDTVVHFYRREIKKLRNSWDRVVENAKLGDDVVPHTCRHTAATWLMQAGVDHFEAAGFLGMSVDTLMRTYGHHHPNFQSSAAQSTTKRAAKLPPRKIG